MRFQSIAFIAVLGALAQHHQPARIASTVPIRPLGPVVARSAAVFGTVASVIAMPRGRLMINDLTAHRVVIADSTLGELRPVLDNTGETARAYGSGQGRIIAYVADSMLFIDVRSLALVVLDPGGRVARIAAIPNPTDALAMTSERAGIRYDGAGHLVYLTSAPALVWRTMPDGQRRQVAPDSDALVRVSLLTSKVDTIGMLSLRLIKTDSVARNDTSGRLPTTTVDRARNPLPGNDDWTMLADGTVAIIRGQGFVVEWIGVDLAKRRSAPTAHEWQHLSDDEKIALIDSARVTDSIESKRQDSVSAARGGGHAPAVMALRGEGGIILARIGGANGSLYIDPTSLPEYRPAFSGHTARADAEGNIWIKITPALPVPGGAIYDVINRNGVLIDRVQIPGGTTLVGFGPGSVYLSGRVGVLTQLARARIR